MSEHPTRGEFDDRLRERSKSDPTFREVLLKDPKAVLELKMGARIRANVTVGPRTSEHRKNRKRPSPASSPVITRVDRHSICELSSVACHAPTLPPWIRATAAFNVSALRSRACRSSSDIAGSRIFTTPVCPRTLGRESVTPYLGL